MDGFSIESEKGFMFAEATRRSGDILLDAVTYTVKSRRDSDKTDEILVKTFTDFQSLAYEVQAFMQRNPVERFRVVMDDYTLFGVRQRTNPATFTMIGVDGFFGKVEQCEADVSGDHYMNVIAVVALAVAGDNLSDSESEDLYPLADLICGNWVSKPYP